MATYADGVEELVTQFNEFIASDDHIVLLRQHGAWIKVTRPANIVVASGALSDDWNHLHIPDARDYFSIGFKGSGLLAFLLSETRVYPLSSLALRWLGKDLSYPKGYIND